MSTSQNKKALLITYYWPPSGGSPVLRWLKFTKYLPEYGWDISVYTPKNPVPQAMDENLLKEVPPNTKIYKAKIKEPANKFGLLSTKKVGKTQATGFIRQSDKKNFFAELAIWIRGNFFIPDARMLWIRPSVKKLTKILSQEHFDAIITTGPPHSMHMIGLKLKKALGIKWLADFRDPWTNIDYYPELKLMKSADKRHRKLEKSVLEHADVVVTVSPTMTEEFKVLGGKNVVTVTNGFDSESASDEVNKDCRFSIMHLGSMPRSRNPEQLWPLLGELVHENQEFKNDLKIHLIGKVDHNILDDIKNNGLNTNLFTEGHMSNKEALKRQKSAQVLLLVINNTPNARGILTNKFFEYMMAKRPILAVGPIDGDAAKILKDTGSGSIFDYEEKELLKEQVLHYYKQFKEANLEVNSEAIDMYSRKNLTSNLAKLLNSL